MAAKRKSANGKGQGHEQLTLLAVNDAGTDAKVAATNVEQTSAQQLFSHLFEACNILRGPINQDEYKTYVTPILFLKRISDVYDEETAKAVAEYYNWVP